MLKFSECQVALIFLALFLIWVFAILPVIYEGPIDHRAMAALEGAAHLSEVLLGVTAVLAAMVAYGQLRASNRYEFLKMLQDKHIRDARSLIWKELCREKEPEKRLQTLEPLWWNNPKHAELEQAASTVCATFDILALMAKDTDEYSFFSREWAPSICWTYEALKEYIDDRRQSNPHSYPSYDKLYRDALPWRRTVT